MRVPRSELRLLVVYAHYAPTLSYYDDWLDAFRACTNAQVSSVDLCAGETPRRFAERLRQHDATVLLHSTNGDTMEYLKPFASVLGERRGKLASFVGNEVNLPGSPIAEKIAFLASIQADLILTQLPIEAGRWLYEGCHGSQIEPVPHALAPDVFQVNTGDREGSIDIGVRSARFTAYLGDDERNELIRYFAEPSNMPGLITDISLTQRFARQDWAQFLNRCRATVSNEAGSWYLERDDATVNAIRDYVMQREKRRGRVVIAADSPLRRLGHRLPWWMRALLRRVMGSGVIRHEAVVNESIEFAEIYAEFFASRAKAPVYSKAISSRHFDAIGTVTCQILLRGRFNDILVADEHYIAFDCDYGNIEEVIRCFKDEAERHRIANTAREFVLGAHTYRHRIDQVVGLLSASM